MFVRLFIVFLIIIPPCFCVEERDEFDTFIDSRLGMTMRREALDSYLIEGKHKKASFVYDCILAHDNSTWVDYRDAGRMALEIGKNHKAADLLERAIKDASELDWESHFLIGKAYLRLKNNQGAYWHANLALHLNPDAPYEAHFCAANAAYHTKRFDEALHILEKFKLPELGREAKHFAMMGISACHLERYVDALKYCEAAMEANPRIERRVYSCAGRAALELGIYEDSLKYYQEVFKSYPYRKWRLTQPQVSVSWNCYAHAALAAFHLKKYKLAEKYFQIAERLHEDRELTPKLYFLWACTSAERVANNPWKEEVELNFFHDRFERKKKKAARKYFSKVTKFEEIELSLDDWYRGASALILTQQYDKAIECIQRVRQIKPDGNMELRLFELVRNSKNKSGDMLASLFSLFQTRTLYDLAIQRENLGDLESSIDAFRSILTKETKTLSVSELYKAASVLYNRKQYDLALQYIALAYTTDHEGYGLRLTTLVGEIHFAKEDYDEARLCFLQVYEVNPTQENRTAVVKCEIMQEVKELGKDDVLQNLSAVFQSSFERQQSYDKALAIIALKDKLGLKEDHSVVQLAATIKTKAAPSEDPKNPYNIRSYLEERHQELVDWEALTPRKEVVTGYEVQLVPEFFAKQGPRVITFGQLPDYPLNFLEDEVAALEARVKSDSNVGKLIQDMTTKTLDDLKFKLFQDGYVQGEFKRKGGADERVPLTQLRLIAIVRHLQTLSTDRVNDEIFSEREETFIRMLYSVAQCHVGQGENIEATYLNVIPSEKRNLEGTQEKFIDQIVNQITLEFGKALSGNHVLLRTVLGLSPDEDIYQPPHQERYYRNLIGRDLALGDFVQFDLYSNTVLFNLFKLNRQNALQHFYNHMSPGQVVRAIAEWASLEEFEAIDHLVRYGMLRASLVAQENEAEEKSEELTPDQAPE